MDKKNTITLLTISDKINIKRSNGLIHLVTIVNINAKNNVITVEWASDNQNVSYTKEVYLDDIVSINPDIFKPQKENILIKNNINQIEIDKNKMAPEPKAESPSKKVAASLNKPSISKDVPSKSTISPIRKSEPNPVKKAVFSNVPISTTNVSPKLNNLRSARRETTIGTKIQFEKSNIINKRKSACPTEYEKQKEVTDRRRSKKPEIKIFDPSMERCPNFEFYKMISIFRDSVEPRSSYNQDSNEIKQISVCVRKRPFNDKERDNKDIDIITISDQRSLVFHECKQKLDLTKYLDNQTFRFDNVFDEDSTNEGVYNSTAKPLVESIFNGSTATCFAYGQTGSGKTFTMSGNGPKSLGMYQLTARDIFNCMNSQQHKSKNLLVGVSLFEIYGGKVHDLLNDKKRLKVLEDGNQQVQIMDLQECPVSSISDVMELISQGLKHRSSGQTAANKNSSRSHAVFQIILRKKPKNRFNLVGDLYGKFSLVDLAGNERGADNISSSSGVRLESSEINKSLLVLKECIRAMGVKGSRIPFRASTLTMVLRDSFIGEDAKTCMIATISPTISSSEQTLNTLRYANRVKELDPECKEEKMEEINEEDEKSVIMLDIQKKIVDEARLTSSESRCLIDDIDVMFKDFNVGTTDVDSCDGINDNINGLISKYKKLMDLLNELKTQIKEEELRLAFRKKNFNTKL